jgi:hypothetical protein
MNPPQRNPLDGAKYREQYLSNLRLQSSNDQKNQNANQIFKNTGQTPSRPPDMRTTTEKAGDLEGAKVDLRSKLGQITDGTIASQIIGELSPEQIRFSIDNWLTIEPDMKRQFSTGVPTSAYIAYLNRLIKKFQLTDGVETGLQQSSGDEIIMSNTQILYGLPRSQIWGVLKGVLDRVSRQFGINVNIAMDMITENETIIPTPEEIKVIQSLPQNIRADINILANDIYKNLPSNKDITDLVGELNVGLANRDSKYTQNILQKLLSVITLEPSVIDQMAEVRTIVADYFAEERGITAEEGTTVEPLAPEATPFESFTSEIGSAPKIKTPSQKEQNVPQMISNTDWFNLGNRNKAVKILFLNARLTNNPDLILTDDKGKEYGLGIKRRGIKLFEGDKATNEALNKAYEDYMAQSDLGMVGNGMKGKMYGKGLSVPTIPKPKISKPYRQSIKHLMDKPIEKPKPYTQFGRYFINKQRLQGEGIMSFRACSGNTVPSLPTEKLSKNLNKVITTLVGKGVPTYEDISVLTKDEKGKLRQICNKCQVDSPAIPKMKGEGEQEDDRFQILRGEIIAGNDNQKITKEFKAMLIKFVNEGRIPRRQANEILHELLLLGY